MFTSPFRSWIGSFERRIALRYLNRTRKAHLDRFPQLATYSFDYISNCIAVNGRYEDRHLEQLEALVRNLGLGGVALDIGANIGNHALALARSFDKVLAFEPNPFVFRLLDINSGLADNVACFPFGLSDTAARAEFWFDRRNFGGGSTAGGRADADSVKVDIELKTLDSLSALSGQSVGLIKIDVEGQEAAVLRGGIETIRRDRPVVVFEIIPSDIQDGKSSVIEWLGGEGYTRFGYIDENPMRTGSGAAGGLPAGLRRLESLDGRFYQMVVALP